MPRYGNGYGMKQKYRPLMRIVPSKPLQLTEKEESKLLELAALHCSMSEMAHSLDFGYENFLKVLEINPEIKAKIDKARALTSSELRKVQLKAALNGNVSMMQFLGRHILNQNDNTGQDALLIANGATPSITDITPEAKEHLEKLTEAIYNKRAREVESETVTDEPINTGFIKGNY
jgi:hypothetical protein